MQHNIWQLRLVQRCGLHGLSSSMLGRWELMRTAVLVRPHLSQGAMLECSTRVSMY